MTQAMRFLCCEEIIMFMIAKKFDTLKLSGLYYNKPEEPMPELS